MKLCKFLNPKPVASRNYVTPEERVEPFIGYLSNEDPCSADQRASIRNSPGT